MLWRLATCVSDIPERRSSTTCSRSMSSRALPICRPSSLALHIPAFTRSTIRLRSNSLIAAVPADVRANSTAAPTLGRFGWRIVEIRVVKRRAVATVATAFEEFSVHVDDSPRTRLLVKAVYVLGADKEAILQGVFKFREGEVGRIRLRCRRHAPTHGIELPHQSGIAVPSLGRCDLFDSVVPPKSTCATEGWDAAFRAYSRPGKNEDAVSEGNGEH
jgi:hypothetical protein